MSSHTAGQIDIRLFIFIFLNSYEHVRFTRKYLPRKSSLSDNEFRTEKTKQNSGSSVTNGSDFCSLKVIIQSYFNEEK